MQTNNTTNEINTNLSNSRSTTHANNLESRNEIIISNLINANYSNTRNTINNKVHILLESSLTRGYCDGCMRMSTNEHDIQSTHANIAINGKHY